MSPILREMGHQVIDDDLPGKGAPLADKEKITLTDHMDRLSEWRDTLPGPVHLIAHGMAGIAVTEFAERRPERIASATYISSLFGSPGEWAQILPYNQELDSRISHLEDGEAIDVTFREVAQLSFTDCPPEDYDRFEECLERDSYDPPVPPLDTPTGHWAGIQRAYIMCLSNKMVLRAQQHQMTLRHKCAPVVKMNTGHCPFLTHPKETATHIDQIIRRVRSDTAAPGTSGPSNGPDLKIVSK